MRSVFRYIFAAAIAAALVMIPRAARASGLPGGRRKPWRVSPAGIAMIKREEGFSATPYLDVAGHKTVGYGTLLTRSHPLYDAPRVTQAQADALLRDHVAAIVEPGINALVDVPLNQNQVDALASWFYNFNPGLFASSTMRRKLNAGDYQGAADEFPRWNKATIGGELRVVQGLVNRRARERDLFLSPISGAFV